MDISTLTNFFMWCVIINGGMYVLSVLACITMSDFMFSLHGKWFNIKREFFNMVLYSYIALYKILLIIFCVVPYIALLVIRK